MRAHGASAADLAGRSLTPAWIRAAASAVRRTRALLDDGRPLCDAVRGRLGYELRATWLGGTRILDRLEAAGYDMIHDVRPSDRRTCHGCVAHAGVVAVGPSTVMALRPFESLRVVASRVEDDGSGQAAMSRDTSFYYSFLVLPPREAPRDHRGVGFLPRR